MVKFLRPFHKKYWKGLKLTTEEMVFIKYMYHDQQKINLQAFLAAYNTVFNSGNKLQMPDWDLYLVDEKRHLTPYILIYKTGLEYFWLVTYNMGEFNLSFHKKEKSSTRVISGGYRAITADQAAKLFIRMFQVHGKNLTESSASK